MNKACIDAIKEYECRKPDQKNIKGVLVIIKQSDSIFRTEFTIDADSPIPQQYAWFLKKRLDPKKMAGAKITNQIMTIDIAANNEKEVVEKLKDLFPNYELRIN